MTTVEDVLEHYGVKGMKWGKRKARSSTTRTRFKKAPSKLSTEELARRIQRMETEKKYNQLNAPDVSPGRAFANDVLTNSGRRVVNTLLVGGALTGIKLALDAKTGTNIGTQVTRRLK